MHTPASPYCQRWRDGRHSFRYADGSRLEPGHYDVAPLDERPARAFVEQHHYSRSYPAARLRYGLWHGARLVGVAVLSVPVQAAVLTSLFPQLRPYTESLELGRFVLLDEVPGNGESWFLGRIARLAADDGIRGLVSYSDPVVRRQADGAVVFPGHRGTIYQSTNAFFTGRSRPRTQLLLPDGSVLNERALTKIRAEVQGQEYAMRLLVAWGATPRRPGESGRAWLDHALAEARVRRAVHSGCYRYAFALGSPAERRALRRDLVASALPYPKSIEEAA